MEKRILVFSWFYPPINSSEGLVTYKLLKASRYEYDVFTQKSNSSWSYGDKDYLPESENVHPIYAESKVLDTWWPEAVEYFRANADKYDIVMTRSMPPESHKIGLEVKKIKPSVTWIASFGDPIGDNPYTKMIQPDPDAHSARRCLGFLGVISPMRVCRRIGYKLTTRRRTEQQAKRERNLQNDIMRACDYVIYNSTYQRDYMLSCCREDRSAKSVVLNHSFDPALYPAEKKQNDRITMSYVGHLDYIRTPKLFLEAVAELAKRDPDLAARFHVDFYGNMGDADKLYIINNELCDIVSVRRPVKYLESLQVMKDSDWLLQVDANITSVNPRNIFFAAKLADYIGAGNPILGITMMDGISADIIRGLGSVCVSYSRNEIMNYLWLIIYEGYRGNSDPAFRESFSNADVARKFDELVDRILSERS